MASGLGLLLTTSFLGLRRYLRQRRLPMPLLMTGTWIALGCALIIGVMGLALLLPRPNAELAVSQLPRVMGSPDQKLSKHGMGSDGVQGDESGRPEPGQKGKPAPGHDDKTQPGGKPADKKDGGKQESAKQDNGKNEGQKPDNPKPGGDKSVSDKTTKPDANEKNRQEPGGDAHERSAGDESKHNAPPKQSGDGNQRDRPQESRDRGEKSKAEKQPENRPGEEPDRPIQDDRPPDTPPPPDVSSILDWLLPLAKVLFYLVIVGLAAFWAWRHRAGIMASLRGLLAGLRSFWERLFGGRRKAAEAAASAENVPPPSRRFADFADPFATGMAKQLSSDQLVRYLFAALEAWARENGCPREAKETPHEFRPRLAWSPGPAARSPRAARRALPISTAKRPTRPGS